MQRVTQALGCHELFVFCADTCDDLILRKVYELDASVFA